MRHQFPFNNLEPVPFAGLMDDPLVWVRDRAGKRAILCDAGSTHILCKSALKAIEVILISHTHMDHWMGIDRIVRSQLVSRKALRIYGPPGLAAKLWHKLAAYEWNLVEDYYINLSVHEVYPDYIQVFHLPGAKGFPLEKGERQPRQGNLLEVSHHLEIHGVALDHKIPSMAYLLREIPRFQIDQNRLAEIGLSPGLWITEMKAAFCGGNFQKGNILPPGGPWSKPIPMAELYEKIRPLKKPASLAYVMDFDKSKSNQKALWGLLQGVDLLISECSYARESENRARSTYHQCTKDINQLLHHLTPRFYMPMHLSRIYVNESETVLAELEMPPGCKLVRLSERLGSEPLRPAQALEAMNTPWNNNQSKNQGQIPAEPGSPESKDHPSEQRIRCFLAIPADLKLGRALQSTQGFQSVSPQNIHLTLAFLGNQEEADLERLIPILAGVLADLPEFSQQFNRLDWFPDPRRPAVLALLAANEEKLQALYNLIKTALAETDIPWEAKPFRPHITIARHQGGSRGRQPLPKGEFTTSLKVDRVLLLRSKLTPQGPLYSLLQEFPLKTS